MGPVQPKGASGYGPKAAPETVGEPDYSALARGEPGFPTGGSAGGDAPLHGVPLGSSATAGLPPSVTGATAGVTPSLSCLRNRQGVMLWYHSMRCV